MLSFSFFEVLIGEARRPSGQAHHINLL